MKKFKQALQKIIRFSVFPFLVLYVIKPFLWLLSLTYRWNIEGQGFFKDEASKHKIVLILWHNRLLMAPFILSKIAPELFYVALISKSRDGELIDRIVRSYSHAKTIRVGHQSKHFALKEVIDHLRRHDDVIVITPDGPRGPVYEMKPGAEAIATSCNAKIYHLDWNASMFWQLNTWDKMRIPYPFAKIDVVVKEFAHNLKD